MQFDVQSIRTTASQVMYTSNHAKTELDNLKPVSHRSPKGIVFMCFTWYKVRNIEEFLLLKGRQYSLMVWAFDLQGKWRLGYTIPVYVSLISIMQTFHWLTHISHIGLCLNILLDPYTHLFCYQEHPYFDEFIYTSKIE